MISQRLIQNYAVAFFDNVETEKREVMLSEISSFLLLVGSCEALAKLLYSPIGNIKEKEAVLSSVIAKLKACKEVENFLLLLLANGRFKLLEPIIAECNRMIEESKNIKQVEVTYATKLTEMDIKDLKKYLENELKSNVDIVTNQDDTLIGGLVVKYDGKLLDCSVAGALERMDRAIKA